MLTIHPIPAYNDNYIWFIQTTHSRHIIIIDPGDAQPAISAIKQHHLIPVAILITHGCHDHVDGIAELLAQYDIPVYGPKNEFIPHITHSLSEGDQINLSPYFPLITVLDLPGHTHGHIGFLIEDNLFCGDTLFGTGCGRLHGNPAPLLFQSLQKIKQLPKYTQIYCAHEYTENNLRFATLIEPNNPELKQRIIDTKIIRQQGKPSIPFSLKLELKTNPFLRCEYVDVSHACQSHSKYKLTDPESVFTALRLWKDNF